MHSVPVLRPNKHLGIYPPSENNNKPGVQEPLSAEWPQLRGKVTKKTLRDEMRDSTDSEKASIEPCQHCLLSVLKYETSADEEILGPPPGMQGIQCSNDEKENFRKTLVEWRTNRWKSIRKENPMLCEVWVLGEHNLNKFIENIHRIINTPEDKLNRQWIRALVDMAASNESVDELASVIREFRSGLLARHGQHPPATSSQEAKGPRSESPQTEIPTKPRNEHQRGLTE